MKSGTVFAGYRLESFIGRGGMGVVYRATDLTLERPVALRLIAPELVRARARRHRKPPASTARCHWPRPLCRSAPGR
jgi:serine/threonine protein kinase